MNKNNCTATLTEGSTTTLTNEHRLSTLENEPDVNSLVAKRLKYRRLEMGLKQIEVAKCLGITFQQIQKYETGENRIFAGRLWQLAKVMSVSPNYFYSDLTAAESVKLPDGDQVEFNVFYNVFKHLKNEKIKQQLFELIMLIVRTEHTSNQKQT